MLYHDRKYVALLSSQLKNFKKKSNDLYSFRCPICGDSEKNQYKSRGYIFASESSLVFKCHNCGDSRSFGKLLQHVDSRLYDEYFFELYKNPKEKDTVSYINEVPVFNLKSAKEILCNFENIGNLSNDHIAIQYLIKRDIPKIHWNKFYYTDNENKLEEICDKYKGRIKGSCPRLIIPILNRNKEMIGCTARALTESKLRYVTIKFDDNSDSMIYGLDEWNSTQFTYVTEGLFDSLFLPNSLAVNGSSMKSVKKLVDKLNTVFILDNEPRNKDICRNINSLIKEGFYVCIWPSKIFFKDINEMHLNGVVDIKRIIDTNTFRNLEAELHYNDWRKCE